MREIEFRGKSIGGEWVYGVLMPFWNRDKEIKMYCIIPYNIGLTKDTSIWEIQIQVDPDTIGQFTGLTDSSRKKIFEGDIVRSTQTLYDRPTLYVISYNEDIASFLGEVSNNRDDYSLLYDLSYNIIIIGNVHDKPELLEGGEDD